MNIVTALLSTILAAVAPTGYDVTTGTLEDGQTYLKMSPMHNYKTSSGVYVERNTNFIPCLDEGWLWQLAACDWKLYAATDAHFRIEPANTSQGFEFCISDLGWHYYDYDSMTAPFVSHDFTIDASAVVENNVWRTQLCEGVDYMIAALRIGDKMHTDWSASALESIVSPTEVFGVTCSLDDVYLSMVLDVLDWTSIATVIVEDVTEVEEGDALIFGNQVTFLSDAKSKLFYFQQTLAFKNPILDSTETTVIKWEDKAQIRYALDRLENRLYIDCPYSLVVGATRIIVDPPATFVADRDDDPETLHTWRIDYAYPSKHEEEGDLTAYGYNPCASYISGSAGNARVSGYNIDCPSNGTSVSVSNSVLDFYINGGQTANAICYAYSPANGQFWGTWDSDISSSYPALCGTYQYRDASDSTAWADETDFKNGEIPDWAVYSWTVDSDCDETAYYQIDDANFDSFWEDVMEGAMGGTLFFSCGNGSAPTYQYYYLYNEHSGSYTWTLTITYTGTFPEPEAEAETVYVQIEKPFRYDSQGFGLIGGSLTADKIVGASFAGWGTSDFTTNTVCTITQLSGTVSTASKVVTIGSSGCTHAWTSATVTDVKSAANLTPHVQWYQADVTYPDDALLHVDMCISLGDAANTQVEFSRTFWYPDGIPPATETIVAIAADQDTAEAMIDNVTLYLAADNDTQDAMIAAVTSVIGTIGLDGGSSNLIVDTVAGGTCEIHTGVGGALFGTDEILLTAVSVGDSTPNIEIRTFRPGTTADKVWSATSYTENVTYTRAAMAASSGSIFEDNPTYRHTWRFYIDPTHADFDTGGWTVDVQGAYGGSIVADSIPVIVWDRPATYAQSNFLIANVTRIIDTLTSEDVTTPVFVYATDEIVRATAYESSFHSHAVQEDMPAGILDVSQRADGAGYIVKKVASIDYMTSGAATAQPTGASHSVQAVWWSKGYGPLTLGSGSEVQLASWCDLIRADLGQSVSSALWIVYPPGVQDYYHLDGDTSADEWWLE